MDKTDATTEAPPNRYVWIFLVITCLLSWSFWLASSILSRQGQGAFYFRWLFTQIGYFGPSLTALIVSGIIQKELRQNALRTLPLLLLPLVIPGVLIVASASIRVTEFSPLVSVATVVVFVAVALFFSSLNHRFRSPGTGEPYERAGTKWILLSITFFPALFLLAWALANLQGGEWTISTLQDNVGGFARVLLVSFAYNLLLGGSLAEEVGWRGFLLPQLLKRNKPLAASLILGVAWALWHLPIDLNAGQFFEVVTAIGFRLVALIPITILFTWFYLHKNSLLVALFLHATINMPSDLGLSRYDTSRILFIVLVAIAALIVAAFSRVFRGSPR